MSSEASSRPLITGSTHQLPFRRLSPADFERLCLWLVRREGYERAEYLGEAGSEQGRDVRAWRGEFCVVFQCKRVGEFGPKDAENEVRKLRALPKDEQPDELVFVVTCPVSVKTRNAARKAWGAEDTCHFWSGGELDERVKRYRDVVAEFFQLQSPEGEGKPKRWNVPARNPYFTGREDVLAELHRRLTADGCAVLGQAIAGLGGIGKTQTVIEYCHRHRGEYAAVFWINSETVPEIRAGFGKVAELLALPEAREADEAVILEAVQRWFATHDGWLLVFDNADRPAELKPFLPTDGGRFLLTSRAATGFASVGIKPFRLPVLAPEEAEALLLGRVDREDSPDEERAAVATLAEELGYLALALEQAAAYVEARQMRYVTYLARFQEKHLTLLEKAGPETGDYTATVATTWAMSFQKVEDEQPASADLLRVLSLLAPDDVPLEIFEQGATELGPHLAEALADDDVAEVVAPLLRYSLVERDIEARTLSVHRMVQAVVRAELGEAERGWAERVVKALVEIWPNPPVYGTWEICERLYPQTLAVASVVEEVAVEIDAAGLVLNQAGEYAHHRGRHEEEMPLFLKALDIQEKTFGSDHPYVCTPLNNLASLYKAQGRYEEAEPLFLKALDIREKVLRKDHPHLGVSLNNLAALYYDQGRYEEAEPLYQRALDISEKALGGDHPDVGTSLNNLAELYRAQGRYEKAELLFQRDLAISEKALGGDHPDVGTSLNNLASLYGAQGRYEEAEPLYQRALDIREKALGSDHPDVSTSLNNLADLYDKQGRYKEAEPLYRRALDIREKVLGTCHPSTVLTRRNYAGFLRKTGRASEAGTLEASEED